LADRRRINYCRSASTEYLQRQRSSRLWCSENPAWSLSDLKRTATCHCGALVLSCEGEPEVVVQCHCLACQRRTGSAFNLAAWFPVSAIEIEGESSSYTRAGDLGIATTFHFCPGCGSNIYWASDLEMIGVAVGCFADPSFPGPTVSIYDSLRHSWMQELPVETYATKDTLPNWPADSSKSGRRGPYDGGTQLSSNCFSSCSILSRNGLRSCRSVRFVNQ